VDLGQEVTENPSKFTEFTAVNLPGRNQRGTGGEPIATEDRDTESLASVSQAKALRKPRRLLQR
jgi:hypothetical protein